MIEVLNLQSEIWDLKSVNGPEGRKSSLCFTADFGR